MKFLNPAGLWLLLGVPVLIFIYLIRPHHEERAVSSTFMWKLSQRFMKRQLPMQRLQRFLLFILQLLLLILAALMIARPALITGKSTEYIAIIDASASMQTVDENGQSRFERAVEQAKLLTDNIDHGHRVSVILAGDNAQFLIQSSDAAGKVRVALDEADCGNGGCNTDKALLLAQSLCSRGESQVIFFTDSPCDNLKNIQLVDLNEGAWNISITEMMFDSDDDGGMYMTATVTSHNRDAVTTVGLRTNGTLTTAQKVELMANEPKPVTFSIDSANDGAIFQIFVQEKDGLELDNSYSLCSGYSRTYSVLLVSESPFYLERVLSSMGNCSVGVVSDPSHAVLKGHDLYIFDGIYPENYPTDGSVLQFGTEKLPEGLEAGNTVQSPARLSMIGGTHHVFYENLSLLGTTVSTYDPLNSTAQWQKILTCATFPVGVTKVNDMGIRTTVISFDLHQSNLPMQTDFVVLMKNILENSVFDLIPDSDFSVGAAVELGVLPNATQMHVKLPDGSIRQMIPENGQCIMTPTDIGVHTAVVATASGGEFADFFVHIPDGEALCQGHKSMSVTISESTADAPDAITELWGWLVAAMLLLLILEWGVYYREQY